LANLSADEFGERRSEFNVGQRAARLRIDRPPTKSLFAASSQTSGQMQDLTFNRGARLITGIAPTDFNFKREVSGLRGAADLQRKAVSTH